MSCMDNMTDRVCSYWTRRAHDFATVRRNELENELGGRWLAEIESHIPQGRALRILDVGTGSGFFSILLGAQGHSVCGIDLTRAMLDEARALADERRLGITFLEMDAQLLEFPDSSFDVVISRNLTWTLPDPRAAYREWLRVLRPGGVLLNFDANYGEQVRRADRQNASVSPDSPYGHIGITRELDMENSAITLAMPASRLKRPDWDSAELYSAGAERVRVDTSVGSRVLGELDLAVAPMFLIKATKSGGAYAS